MADWWKDEELVNQVVTEANGGNTAAQCEMARKCMAEQDISEAVKWYKMAAAAGTADAMFNLGLLYSKGWEGETASPEQAFFWFESAAAAGDTEAMYMVGENYLTGRGTETNLEQASYWLNKALSAGYIKAQELLYTIPGQKEAREDKLKEIREEEEKAEAFLEQEDYAGALPFLQLALEKSTEKLGEQDACTIRLMNNLAVALSSMEQFDKSIPMKERVLELRGKSLPLTHPEYLTAVTNLTSDYAKVGRYQSAINLSRQAYAAAREGLAMFDEVTLLTLNRLAADYMCLCRHDLALEQLNAFSLPESMESELSEEAKKQWERTGKLKAACQEAMEQNAVYFRLSESRRNYARICAELCEMLDGLPEDYRNKIRREEYDHFKEQAELVSCYRPHMNSGQAVETDPYTNALQTLISLKYLMPGLAECQEELDGISCRTVVTWVQNELYMITTVYPKKTEAEHMNHPQPVDFIKPLNALAEPDERVISIDSVDLRLSRLDEDRLEICFAYGVNGQYRMIRMYYAERENILDGEPVFSEMKPNA